MYAVTKEKVEFFEKLEEGLNKHTIRIVLEDAHWKVGRKTIYRYITGRESKHQVINYKGKR